MWVQGAECAVGAGGYGCWPAGLLGGDGNRGKELCLARLGPSLLFLGSPGSKNNAVASLSPCVGEL